MEDVHSFHTRTYDKSEPLDGPTPIGRALTILALLPSIVLKTSFVILMEIFYILRELFYLMVPRPLKDIRGQLAAVTGGSNGIGREICLELARNGCNVACLDLDLDAAKKLCDELKVLGVKANAYKVDITDYKRIEEVKKEINTEMGIVDILINNAGLMPSNSFRDGEPEDLRRVLEVNVLSHFWTTRIFIGDMIARRYGHIVGVSSMIAFYPMSIAVAYTTSKYAVKGFMDALNRDSRHENWGVRALTIFPHMTNTRKEIVDYLRKKVNPTTLSRVGLLKPQEVGRETVAGIRDGSRYVCVPRYYMLMGKFFQSLTSEVQDIADDLFMPRINSKTDYSGEYELKTSVTSNGHKKSH